MLHWIGASTPEHRGTVADPLISVVVPTFNRVDMLRRNLHSLVHQSADRASYEIIVVDNNSTDATRQTVAGIAQKDPRIRYVSESRQGLSHAKNAGLQAARGAIVAYIDDDALPGRQWVSTLLQSFERTKPRPHVVGGPILPFFFAGKPTWYLDSYESFSWGENERFLVRGECFYGSNAAFEREILAGVGGFAPDLGQQGSNLGVGEDNEVFERLWDYVEGRLVAYYTPEAYVLHAIPPSRASASYRVKRAFAAGQSQYRQTAALPSAGRTRAWLRGLYLFVRSIGWALRRYRSFPHTQNWVVECAAPVAKRLGYLIAASGGRLDISRSH